MPIVFQGLGLCVLVIGFKMALLTQNPLIVIFSIVIGSVAGEMIGSKPGSSAWGTG